MQLLEAIESISRQRSVETVELALLQTLGQNFSEVEEALLVVEYDGRLWISSHWYAGRLCSSERLELLSDPQRLLVAREALLEGHAREGDNQAWRLAPQDTPTQLLLLSGEQLQEDGQRALRSLINIVENFSRLLSEKNRDRLTGLLNRHQLEERILHALALAEDSALNQERRSRQRHPSWLAILDIDHFKQINDNYGHLFGDEVLLLVSRLMVDCFRREDQLFRYGGEEFVILLNDLGADEVHLVLERFRQQLSQHDFPQLKSLTISIGYTCIGHQGSASAVLGQADQALYWAKQNGRNRLAEYAQLLDEGKLQGVPSSSGSIDLF